MTAYTLLGENYATLLKPFLGGGNWDTKYNSYPVQKNDLVLFIYKIWVTLDYCDGESYRSKYPL